MCLKRKSTVHPKGHRQNLFEKHNKTFEWFCGAKTVLHFLRISVAKWNWDSASFHTPKLFSMRWTTTTNRSPQYLAVTKISKYLCICVQKNVNTYSKKKVKVSKFYYNEWLITSYREEMLKIHFYLTSVLYVAIWSLKYIHYL